MPVVLGCADVAGVRERPPSGAELMDPGHTDRRRGRSGERCGRGFDACDATAAGVSSPGLDTLPREVGRASTRATTSAALSNTTAAWSPPPSLSDTGLAATSRPRSGPVLPLTAVTSAISPDDAAHQHTRKAKARHALARQAAASDAQVANTHRGQGGDRRPQPPLRKPAKSRAPRPPDRAQRQTRRSKRWSRVGSIAQHKVVVRRQSATSGTVEGSASTPSVLGAGNDRVRGAGCSRGEGEAFLLGEVGDLGGERCQGCPGLHRCRLRVTFDEIHRTERRLTLE